ncbi:MAG: DUF5320 domain-containing protein [Tissierellia bacterium]|jgi:hypothetical protein|nr:DUF5320 domain-containing protein [Tissierellia bacterium]NMA23602.1 DUF5320 domain-containing protein [Spirochaetales bacterium]
MPRRDGSGPIGNGAMQGRGLGPCAGIEPVRYGAGYGRGAGLGCRRGFGRAYNINYDNYENMDMTENELLKEENQLLKSRLEAIEAKLENL